jgi:hypothetical protein
MDTRSHHHHTSRLLAIVTIAPPLPFAGVAHIHIQRV